MIRVVALFALLALANADVYLQMPRGSNNRLDEANRARNNGDRLFDSQNNNRGGYNVGSVYYYAGSEMNIEWTNQHSCGNPNNNCEIIIQYMCDNLLRDGTTTDTIPDTPDSDKNVRFGRHESNDWYQNCKWRSRNKGLFTANQNLQGNAAQYTRQNANGDRQGYECPEERDYYPYWHPSPWRDIAIYTNQPKRCAAYQAESQNVKSRFYCKAPQDWINYQIARNRKGFIPINQTECEQIRSVTDLDPVTNQTKPAIWTEVPAWGMAPPACSVAPWSRDNHLGNVEGGDPMSFNWTIPNLPHERCVLRLRYNISTGEYNDWLNDFSVQSSAYVNSSLSYKANDQSKDPAYLDVWSKFNLAFSDVAASFDKNNNDRNDPDLKKSRDYVFKNNPRVNLFGDLIDAGGDTTTPKLVRLQLAINTNQFGRTFEDRSHRFAIRSVPQDLADDLSANNGRIVNLQVRGKRGNIVQTFPGTEYDFHPQRLAMRNGDYIHFQWTGSNTNPDNNAGQGKAGTDRHNAVLLNYPVYEEGQQATNPPTYGQWGANKPSRIDNASMPFLGFSVADRQRLAILSNMQFGGEMSELDDAGTYFDLGPRKVTSNGIYHYLCTRNNNFSNRDQRARIVVSDSRLASAMVSAAAGVVDAGNARLLVSYGQVTKPTLISIVTSAKSAKSSIDGDVASEYVEVQPMTLPLVAGQSLSLQINYDKNPIGTSSMYRSDSMFGSWSSQSADFEDGVGTTKINRGGVYVIQSPTNWGAVAGVTLASLAVIFACIFAGYRKYRMPSTTGMEKGRV